MQSFIPRENLQLQCERYYDPENVTYTVNVTYNLTNQHSLVLEALLAHKFRVTGRVFEREPGEPILTINEKRTITFPQVFYSIYPTVYVFSCKLTTSCLHVALVHSVCALFYTILWIKRDIYGLHKKHMQKTSFDTGIRMACSVCMCLSIEEQWVNYGM